MIDDRVSLAALDAATNDYESAVSVCSELNEFLNESLTEQDLFSIFRTLEAKGLVTAYRATSNGQLTALQSSASDSVAEIWFLTTAVGRQIVEAKWESTFGKASD